MTKSDFRSLFLRALNVAAENAEAKLGKRVPRSFRIELHAPLALGRSMSVDEALDQLYLGDDRFYRIIDVAIKELLPGKSLVFARVSGHPPAGFNDTWDRADLGPFKQIKAEKTNDRRVRSG